MRELLEHLRVGQRQHHPQRLRGRVVIERSLPRHVPHQRRGARRGQRDGVAPVIEGNGRPVSRDTVRKEVLAERGDVGFAVAELPVQHARDARPRPLRGLLVGHLRREQGVPQLPQRVLGIVVRDLERRVERLVVLLERERVVAVDVRIGGEQEDDFSDSEVREINLQQHFGEAQGVRGQRVPRVGRERRIEAGQLRQRIEIVPQQLQQFRAIPPVAARARVVLDSIEKVVHGPGPHRRPRPHPEREDVRTVRACSAGRRNGARVDQPQGELVPEHLKRRELTDEVGIDRVVVEQLQDGADVSQLHEGVAGPAGAAQLSPEADEDRQLVEALFGSPRVRKVDPQILEAARFALGKLAVPFVGAVAELDEP